MTAIAELPNILAPTSTLVRDALPVYRCANCFRRHDDHRGPSLHCPAPAQSAYELIPYESHRREQGAA